MKPDLKLLESAPESDWREDARKGILRLDPPGERIEVEPGAVTFRHCGRQWVISERGPDLELTISGRESWSYPIPRLHLARCVCPSIPIAYTQGLILREEAREKP